MFPTISSKTILALIDLAQVKGLLTKDQAKRITETVVSGGKFQDTIDVISEILIEMKTEREENHMNINWEKIQKATEAIESGLAKKIEVDDNTMVYAAGTVIRVDIKGALK